MSLEANIMRIRSEVSEAAERSGRDPSCVRVIAVTKTVDRAAVDAAYELGLREFGENRIQDAKRKFSNPLPEDAVLHLIGHLQTNKAKDAVALFQTIHSVDRPALLDMLQRRAEQANRVVDILIQVNVAGEEQKHGCRPEEALELLRRVVELPNLRIRGLMTIAPLVDDSEAVRPVFRNLRELRDRLQEHVPAIDLTDLSMGMTNDFQVAIEEGATMVRVGRAIFSE